MVTDTRRATTCRCEFKAPLLQKQQVVTLVKYFRTCQNGTSLPLNISALPCTIEASCELSFFLWVQLNFLQSPAENAGTPYLRKTLPAHAGNFTCGIIHPWPLQIIMQTPFCVFQKSSTREVGHRTLKFSCLLIRCVSLLHG